jgi:hypothetical protein
VDSALTGDGLSTHRLKEEASYHGDA